MSVPRLPDVSRERVADVSRQAWSVRRDRLAASVKPILLAALAASLAWFIARYVLGQRAPFFAPIAALVVIGLTVGQRARRAVELAVGQAVGILVADALIGVIGIGVVQIALVIVLAMVTAVLVGSGPLLTQQAATSAARVATIQLRAAACRARASSTRWWAAASRWSSTC
ncbi:MAG: FUSC family protein [Solirubrobacteraceae bacterium]